MISWCRRRTRRSMYVCPCAPLGRAHPYALFKGFTLQNESFEVLKGVGDKQLFLEVPFCVIIPCPYGGTVIMERISVKDHGGPEVSIGCTLRNPSFRRALWSGKFWAIRFGTTLQYGSHYCFHSDVPFGGRYILLGTHRKCLYVFLI